MRLIKHFLLLISVVACISACDSTGEPGTTQFAVRLTDLPASYDGLFIDIQDVQVNYTTDADQGWRSLDNVSKGVYNILDYTSGADTLIATGIVPASKVQQVRLVLGNTNSVNVYGQIYNLVPSSDMSGLAIPIAAELVEGIGYELLMDFDAGQSVKEVSGGSQFILKPTIRTILNTTTGAITGDITPGKKYYVKAISQNDTISTFSAENGAFLLRGVSDGVYELEASITGYCDDPNQPATDRPGTYTRSLGEISIVNGKVEELGSIDFGMDVYR